MVCYCVAYQVPLISSWCFEMASRYLGEDLIFIISQPRSGSTLLQRVLAGHPDIQTSAETWLMLHPVYALKQSGIQTEYDAKFAAQGVEEFLTNYGDGMAVYDDAIREWARVIYRNSLEKNNKKFFLDKTPRYFFIVPELFRLFPKATFIVLMRNPMAVLASILSTYVKNKWPVIEFFRPDLLLAPRLILEGLELLGDKAIRIQYEAFVSSPEKACRSICEALGIEFYEEMLNYGNTPAPKGSLNDPVGIHRHTKPSTTSLEKWKELASDTQHRHFALSYLEDLGPDIVNRMGYAFDDIFDALQHTSGYGQKQREIFPWSIAMKPKEDWTLREHVTADRYFAIRNRGYFKGNLFVFRKTLRDILRLTFKQMRAVD